jgi:hypothetical protein
MPRNFFIAAFTLITLTGGFGFAASAQGPMKPSPSILPATQPTQLPPANVLPAPIAATPDGPSASKSQTHRAVVTYAAGMLDVRANNSSLNQILREISRLTGMKITGGVADERVFGNYGPAEPSTILATLLDGTGSNMLIRETASNAPAELVLTPRNGGATPPSPNAPGFDDGPPEPEEVVPAPPRGFAGGLQRVPSPRVGAINAAPTSARPAYAQAPTATQQMPPTATQTAPQLPVSNSGPPVVPQPLNNINGSAANTSPTASTLPVTNSVPTDSLPTPSTTPATAGIVDAPNSPPAGNTTAGSLVPTGNPVVPATSSVGTANGGTVGNPPAPASSTGPSTPEQIFQQLQQLRQQSQQPAPPPASPAPATPPQ